MSPPRYLIVGGAGFLGGHFSDHLLNQGAHVTIYDREISNRRHANLTRVRADVENAGRLQRAMKGQDVVLHLASNPDLKKAQSDPDLDFRQGTVLTRHVLEAMRKTGVSTLLFASGSGVYGDLGDRIASEDHGPCLPVSPYGASKLASEAMISSYCHMFGLRAGIFRFANVVGPGQTHGVGYDFIRKLRRDPARLEILGDGKQTKSYVHVDDIVEAVLLAKDRLQSGAAVFNVAGDDAIDVDRIAELAVEVLGLNTTRFERTGGSTGWKGDVPVVHLDSAKIRALGWRPRYCSEGAMRAALEAMREETNAPELSIVIPALDEERTIVPFLEWCHEGIARAKIRAEIIIVDSSHDRTAELAQANGARVIRVPARGLGRAYRAALPFVRGKFVLMGDCDCTYDFRELSVFVDRLREGFDLVMGSRFAGSIEQGAMPPIHQYFGIPVTTWFLNRVASTEFEDAHCGMRAITREALVSMNLQADSWEYASEMLVKAAKLGLKTTQVGVRFLRDREGRVSHHRRLGWWSPWHAGLLNIRAVLRHARQT